MQIQHIVAMKQDKFLNIEISQNSKKGKGMCDKDLKWRE